MRLSFDDEESFKEAVGSLVFNNPPSDPNSTPALPSQRVGSSSSMPSQERNEGIMPSDPNSLQRVGSGSNLNMPSQERIEVI